MHFSPQKNSELTSLIFILIIAIIFIALSMYIDLMYKINVLYNLLKVYAKVPIADFLFNIVFLIIAITILILYIRWNEVKKRNRELENIIDSITPDVFIVVDSAGKIQLCSSSIENTFGFKREEVLDKNINNLISNGVGISSQYDELYNRFRKKGFHIGIGTGICKDDRQIPVEIVRAELKFSGGSVLLVRDISERKRLEEELTRYRETLEEMVAESTAELRKANEQLKSEIANKIRLEMQLRRERDFNKIIIETAPVFFVAINPNGKTIMMNKTMLDALGYKEDEVVGTDYLKTFVPDDEIEKVSNIFNILLSTDRSISVENNVLKKNGEKILVEWRGKQVLNEAGELEFFIGLGTDITERKQYEDALKESEEKYRNLVEKSIVGIIVTKENKIIFCNRREAELFGYKSIDKLRGNFLEKYIHKDDLPKFMEINDKVMAGTSMSEPTIFRGIRADGEIVFIESFTIASPFMGENTLLSFHLDVTERVEAENEVKKYQKQLQKLYSEAEIIEEQERRRVAEDLHDSVGQLLALAKIKMKMYMENEEMLQKYKKELTEIEQYIEDSLKIVKGAIFELSPPSLYELGLVDALDEMLKKLGGKSGINVEFIYDRKPKTLNIEFKLILYRIIRELMMNTIKHSNAKNVKVILSTEDDIVRIVFTDDGIGFDVSKVFSYEKKSGFGLFSIRERLNYFGGNFDVHSEKGKGSKFVIEIPFSTRTKFDWGSYEY